MKMEGLEREKENILDNRKKEYTKWVREQEEGGGGRIRRRRGVRGREVEKEKMNVKEEEICVE